MRVSVTNAAITQTITVDGASDAGANSDVLNIGMSADFDDADTASLTLTNRVSVDYVETINVTSSAEDAEADDVIDNGANFVLDLVDAERVSTINVTATDAAVSITDSGSTFTALNTFNAGDSTAAITATFANATQGVVGTGGSGDDVFTGSAFADELTLGAGDDTVDGGDGNDEINGGAGDDEITGGDGDDTVTLGDGDDTFVFSAAATNGEDAISDFVVADDLIDLDSDVAAEDVAADAAAVVGVTGDVFVFADGADGTGTQAIADYEDLADVAAFLESAITADDAHVYYAVINDLATGNAYVYDINVDGEPGSGDEINDGDLTLIGVITTDAALTAANIA